MVNATLLWMLVLPIILSALSVYFVPKLSNGDYNYAQGTGFGAVGLLISAIILSGAFYAGVGSKTADTEIWNGEVVGKTRVHGTYVESYKCRCRTVTKSSGSGKDRRTWSEEECDTCYRDHFTVKWDCQSNIGEWRIDSLDETSKRVYSAPDPARWTAIKNGDPVSRTNGYTNYVKAVPESLFRPAAENLKVQFAGQIPAYPLNIYDFYKIDRVIPIGVNIDTRDWNDKLSNITKKLGPAKQANVVIVITKNSDPNYFYALQDAWVGGKKNDVVVVIGAPNYPAKAEWVRIMAFTDHDIFRVKLRDDILDIEGLNSTNVTDAINKNILQSFKRKSMKDFKYLEDEIDPPEWVMATVLSLILAAYFVFWIVVYRTTRKGYNTFRRFR